jgi:hypothetical protein
MRHALASGCAPEGAPGISPVTSTGPESANQQRWWRRAREVALWETWRRSPIDRGPARWRHRIQPELPLPVYRPNASSSSASSTSASAKTRLTLPVRTAARRAPLGLGLGRVYDQAGFLKRVLNGLSAEAPWLDQKEHADGPIGSSVNLRRPMVICQPNSPSSGNKSKCTIGLCRATMLSAA